MQHFDITCVYTRFCIIAQVAGLAAILLQIICAGEQHTRIVYFKRLNIYQEYNG